MRRLFSLILTLWPSMALAAESDGVFTASLKVMAALAVVLGIVLLLYAASRKGFGFLPAAKGGAIKVVEMRHLAPKKALCLVEVRGQELLLSVGADRIELLTRLGSKPEEESFEKTLISKLEAGQ